MTGWFLTRNCLLIFPIICLSFAAFKILFVFVFHYFDYNVFGCGSLQVHLTQVLLSFLDVQIHVFMKFGKFSVIISLNILYALFSLLSFQDSHYVHVGVPDDVLQASEALFTFRHYFCSLFLRLDTLSAPVCKMLALLPAPICYSAPLMCISFQSLHFSTPKCVCLSFLYWKKRTFIETL